MGGSREKKFGGREGGGMEDIATCGCQNDSSVPYFRSGNESRMVW